MTQSEKAKQLIKKHLTAIAEESMDSDKMMFYNAKQCAIITVKEFIEEYQSMSDLESTIVIGEDTYSVVNSILWWEQVLEDILNTQE
jgi:predicted RNA binding protein with dsRBD fold (UPF0201 family)